MCKAVMPTSSATNFYDLLSDIRKLVLEEPKRLDMDCWIDTSTSRVFGRQRHKEYPACGKVGCIGGWADVLQTQPTRALFITAFGDESASPFFELCYDEHLLNQANGGLAQTYDHALATAEHIQLFQTKYESQLKSAPVVPKGTI